MLRQNRGYTLVELTISLALFSFIMLAVTTTIIYLFNVYEKGIAVRATQTASRSLAESINRDANETAAFNTGPDILCLHVSANTPGQAYVYRRDAAGVVFRSTPTNLDSAACNTGGATETRVIDTNVRALSFVSTQSPTYNRLGEYTFEIAANSDPGNTCAGGPGGQYCSITRINGSILVRKQ